MNLAAKSGRIVLLKRQNLNDASDQTPALSQKSSDIKDDVLEPVNLTNVDMPDLQDSALSEGSNKFKSTNADASRNLLSYKERELAYKEARRRIFGSSSSSYAPTPNDYRLQSPNIDQQFRPRPPVNSDQDLLSQYSAAQLLYGWPETGYPSYASSPNGYNTQFMSVPGIVDRNIATALSPHRFTRAEGCEISPLQYQPSFHNYPSYVYEPLPISSHSAHNVNSSHYNLPDQSHQFAPFYMTSLYKPYIEHTESQLTQQQFVQPRQEEAVESPAVEAQVFSSMHTPEISEKSDEIELIPSSTKTEGFASYQHLQNQSATSNPSASSYDIDFPPL